MQFFFSFHFFRSLLLSPVSNTAATQIKDTTLAPSAALRHIPMYATAVYYNVYAREYCMYNVYACSVLRDVLSTMIKAEF